MSLTFRLSPFIIIVSLNLLFSCNSSRHNKNGVELAMKQYDHLIKKMDTDSIAWLYSDDGDLGNMAHGRDSIRKFLSKFKNFKVLSQSSVTESIKITKDTSLQIGTYNQTTVLPEGDTVKVKGEYTATWVWASKNGWQIRRMETKPVK